MRGRLSMSTRKELIAATRLRYCSSTPKEKLTILEGFVGLTKYHRKHAIRALNQTTLPTIRKPRDRIYGEALKLALVMLWEAGDRLCSKRLKAQLPILIEALERHCNIYRRYKASRLVIMVSAWAWKSAGRDLRKALRFASFQRKAGSWAA